MSKIATKHAKSPTRTVTEVVVSSAKVQFGQKAPGIKIRGRDVDLNKVIYIDPLKG